MLTLNAEEVRARIPWGAACGCVRSSPCRWPARQPSSFPDTRWHDTTSGHLTISHPKAGQSILALLVRDSMHQHGHRGAELRRPNLHILRSISYHDRYGRVLGIETAYALRPAQAVPLDHVAHQSSPPRRGIARRKDCSMRGSRHIGSACHPRSTGRSRRRRARTRSFP
jgi:hypothetical protein